MTYQELKKALRDKLDCSRQALDQRVARNKSRVPMSTEEAVCLIAFENRLDISKYVDREMVEAVRRLQQQQYPAQQPRGKPGRSESKSVTVTIAKDIELKDPLLSTQALREARLMAEQVYPRLYLLENSVRKFIFDVLDKAHGKDWWETAVPADVRKVVAGRMEEENRRHWHGKRRAHPIYYTDFGHLRRIVISNQNWEYFAPLLPSQEWLTQKLDELEPSRNVIAHCNPLHKDDVERLTLYLRDWQKQTKVFAAAREEQDSSPARLAESGVKKRQASASTAR